MKKSKRLILEVGDGDIAMLRDALISTYRSKPSPLRVLAALRFGGRNTWAEIVAEWDRVQEKHAERGRMTMFRVFSDGSGNAEFAGSKAEGR